MSRQSLLIWGLIIGMAVVIGAAPMPAAAETPVERVIPIKAGNFAYDPAVIQVNRGDRVTLELISTDVVHGIFIDGYNLEVTADPGQTARLTFVADKSGAFRLRCSVTCGDLHPFMIGKLRVGQNVLLGRFVGLALVSLLAGVQLYRQTSQN